MADLKEIQELAGRTEPLSVQHALQQKYNDGLKYVGKKGWQGWLQASASGFGKGFVITGLVIVAAMAIFTGLEAHAAGKLFEEGFKHGLGNALNYMLSSWEGWMVMLGGGAIGAVSDTVRSHNRMTAQQAMTEARELEHIRALKQQQLQPVVARADDFGEKCLASGESFDFCAREAKRRAGAQKTHYGIAP